MDSHHVPGALLDALRRHAQPLADGSGTPAPLLQLLGKSRFALLGEASHGTHEFYEERAQITKDLITQHRFQAAVIEGDWPDAYRVNRWVRGLDDDGSAAAALAGFERFPAWMWRNTVVRDFVQWLREHNMAQPPWERVGFYGMDLYSLFGSVQAVLHYLDRADPEAAQRARLRYACFDHFQQDLQAYGYAAGFGTGFSCEDEVVAQLLEMRRSPANAAPEVDGDPDALFHAQQNARLVTNAEQYYRSMFKGRVSSWNLRDAHMVETLHALSGHLAERSGRTPRIAVWAHNSHLGDASATAMGEQGEWNVGELMRRRFPGECALLGFTTHSGTVMAASNWDEPGQVMQVRPALPHSWEAAFHQVGPDRFLLMLRDAPELAQAAPMLERAIGVIYLPESERRSHYFRARLAAQFDAVIHMDETRALEPLPEPGTATAAVEAPETYPSGV
jgi:erythromycin esterase-like protein